MNKVCGPRGSRAAVAAAAMAALCGAVTGPGIAAAPAPRAAAAVTAKAGKGGPVPGTHAPLPSRLPSAAAGRVSRYLGQTESGYRVRPVRGVLVARNPAQHLVARFSSAGVAVRSGPVSERIRLAGYGFGARLMIAGEAAPSAAANRVRYRLGRITQWYANGPLGLEQGFTVAAPPRGPGRSGLLTLALSVTGGARVTRERGGVTFRRAGSSLAYGRLVVSDARGRRLPARISLAPQRVLIHADVRGAAYPVTVDPMFQQVAELTEAAGQANDNLGSSVAVSGATLAVGAPGANGGNGAVYVFTEPRGGWANDNQPAVLTAPGGLQQFGFSVAVSGPTVVAGAPLAAAGNGAVYAYTEPAGGWADDNAPARLNPAGGTGLLGSSVAVSGTTVIAGAPATNGGQGAADVYTEPGGGWVTMGATAVLGGSGLGSRGYSVAVSGTTAVAGLPDAGQVDVYTEPVSGWVTNSFPIVLTAPGSADLGISVAVSGTTIVAGAPTTTVGGNVNQGAAYVYTEPGGGWADSSQPAGELTAADGTGGDRLGSSVAASGTTVVAGAPFDDGQLGSAYLFAERGGGWSDSSQPAGELTSSDGPAHQHPFLGRSVGADGGTIVAGAPQATFGASLHQGAAYVFGQAPPPVQLALGGILSPRHGTWWRPGSVVPVSTVVHYINGPPIPAALAAGLGASCGLTIQARGAQVLSRRCLRYNSSTGRFSYRWRLGTGRTGPVRIGLRLSYRSGTTVWQQIMIGTSSAAPGCLFAAEPRARCGRRASRR